MDVSALRRRVSPVELGARDGGDSPALLGLATQVRSSVDEEWISNNRYMLASHRTKQQSCRRDAIAGRHPAVLACREAETSESQRPATRSLFGTVLAASATAAVFARRSGIRRLQKPSSTNGQAKATSPHAGR